MHETFMNYERTI